MATGDAQSHPDPEIRRAMQRIAPDETRHAALAWTIAQWLDTKLNDGARARVRAARDAEARRIVSRACDGSAKVLASLLWNVAS
jgi:hypothetical protein